MDDKDMLEDLMMIAINQGTVRSKIGERKTNMEILTGGD